MSNVVGRGVYLYLSIVRAMRMPDDVAEDVEVGKSETGRRLPGSRRCIIWLREQAFGRGVLVDCGIDIAET